MKKFLIILCIFILTGCSTSKFDETKTFEELEKIEKSQVVANTSAKGFKYYKPRDFSLIEEYDFNHILVHKGNKYYLNIDVNAYHDKMPIKYTINTEAYLSKKIEYDDNKVAYIEIKEVNNSYFLVKMMYNYSSVEVSVKESEIYDALTHMMIILSSIRYNDNVIENIINEADLDSRENAYEIKQPKVKNEKTNVLDVYDNKG